MPNDLFPTYRPLPVLVRSVVIVLSMWASAVSTWERLTFLQPIAIIRGWRSVPPFWECVAFAAKVRGDAFEDIYICMKISWRMIHLITVSLLVLVSVTDVFVRLVGTGVPSRNLLRPVPDFDA